MNGLGVRYLCNRCPEIDAAQIQVAEFFRLVYQMRGIGNIWSAYHLGLTNPFCGASRKQHIVS